MATESWMRAAERDREETVEILRWAYAEGQLNLTELEERAEMAFRARMRDTAVIALAIMAGCVAKIRIWD